MPPNVPIPSDDTVVFTYHSLAKPRMDMFDPIKRTVTTSLKMEFERFKSTDIYEGDSIVLSIDFNPNKPYFVLHQYCHLSDVHLIIFTNYHSLPIHELPPFLFPIPLTTQD